MGAEIIRVANFPVELSSDNEACGEIALLASAAARRYLEPSTLLAAVKGVLSVEGKFREFREDRANRALGLLLARIMYEAVDIFGSTREIAWRDGGVVRLRGPEVA